VVETDGLENRLAFAGYGGSNPSPSANMLIINLRGIIDARAGFLGTTQQMYALRNTRACAGEEGGPIYGAFSRSPSARI
jgi:hypothetical protein